MIKNLSLCAIALLCMQCSSQNSKNKSGDLVAFDIHDIDESADPCQDFYQWSVGNWMKNNPVPSTESRWMSFNILAQQNDQKLKDILAEITSSTGHEKGSSKQLLADLYLSAKNRDKNADKNLDVLKPYLELTDSIQSVEELYKFAPKFMEVGVSAGMAYYVGADRKNSAQNITTVYQSGLSLPNRDYYLKKEQDFADIRKAYKSHIESMFTLTGLEGGAEAANDILEFETQIANIYWSKRERRDPNKSYNMRMLDMYDDSLQNIPLKYLLTEFGIKGIDSLIIAQPSYIRSFDSLIGVTPMSQIRSYLKWRIVDSYASLINAETEKANFEFYGKTLSGKKEMKPEDERILKLVDRMLSEPFGKLFVEKHFPPESKAYMAEMIENLRAAYRESIVNLTWMSDETKEKALEKLAAFTYKVGYPDKWKDYSKLDINPDVLVQNAINIRQYRRAFMLDKIGKPVDRSEWGMPPQMVNAYYNASNNEIVFPAGILQPPFFHPSFDDAINYGGIGGVIGHEFTHGFDDQGSKFDANGNLSMWWTPEDREKFNKLTSRLAEQYSNYQVIDSMTIDGRMTLGENIADLGGVTLGYAALKKKLGDNTPEPIDGFTWQQRFFLGWANVWKGNITDEELKNRLINDYHSPGKYRVLGPLSNSPEFQEAFDLNCENGSVKKKEDQIKIW